jgi:hypothetical protein
MFVCLYCTAAIVALQDFYSDHSWFVDFKNFATDSDVKAVSPVSD